MLLIGTGNRNCKMNITYKIFLLLMIPILISTSKDLITCVDWYLCSVFSGPLDLECKSSTVPIWHLYESNTIRGMTLHFYSACAVLLCMKNNDCQNAFKGSLSNNRQTCWHRFSDCNSKLLVLQWMHSTQYKMSKLGY